MADPVQQVQNGSLNAIGKPTLWVLGGPKFPEKLSEDATCWQETKLSSHYQPIAASDSKGLWVHNQEKIARWYVDSNLSRDQTSVTPPRDLFAHAILNYKLYIMGGEKLCVSKRRTAIRDCRVYQCKEKKWDEGPELLHETSGRGAVVFGGCIYLTPGKREQALGKLNVFQPRFNVWEEVKGVMNTPRYGHAISTCHKHIWIFGGQGEYHQVLGDVERYNFTDHTWQVMNPLRVPRTCLSVTLFQGKFYAIGGKTKNTDESPDVRKQLRICGEVELFDPQENSWRLGPGLCHPRAEHGSIVLPPED